MAMFSSASIYYTICFEILETTTLNTLEGNCKFTTAMINSIISPSLTTRPLQNEQPILFSFFSYFVECCRLSNIIHTLLCSISITLRTKRLKRKKNGVVFHSSARRILDDADTMLPIWDLLLRSWLMLPIFQWNPDEKRKKRKMF